MPTYGYSPPRKPELSSYRVIVCESEIERYTGMFPMLTREEILAEMIAARPDRALLEQRLSRRAAERAAARDRPA